MSSYRPPTNETTSSWGDARQQELGDDPAFRLWLAGQYQMNINRIRELNMLPPTARAAHVGEIRYLANEEDRIGNILSAVGQPQQGWADFTKRTQWFRDRQYERQVQNVFKHVNKRNRLRQAVRRYRRNRPDLAEWGKVARSVRRVNSTRLHQALFEDPPRWRGPTNLLRDPEFQSWDDS